MNKDELYSLLMKHPLKYLNYKCFRRKFPSYYIEINNLFPFEMKFSQKAFHYFKNDFEMKIGICPICGKRTSFRSFTEGYKKYCSSKCAHMDEQLLSKTQETMLRKYGGGREGIINKIKNTKKERYGDENYNNTLKNKETCLRKYNHYGYFGSDAHIEIIKEKSNNKSKEEKESIINKIKNTKKERYGDENYNNMSKNKETCLKKYGVDNYTKTNEYKNKLKECNTERVYKIFETKKEHKTINTSQVEKDFEMYLIDNNIEYKKQYKDNRYCDECGYKFHCDFYLPKYDLFIEIQGNWTHGKHPFNKNNSEDLKIIEQWKSKNSRYYNKAIYNWSISDVKKREIAHKNGLNFVECFTKNVDDVINKIITYIEYDKKI